MQRSSIGLGPALKKVRERRGVSIAEASRDTRIRAEFLEALEDEDFDRLLGDVHVRGCLRSYASYLGVPADRVLEVYGRHTTEADPAPTAAKPPETDLAPPRRRDNARLVIMIAAAILVLAGAFGVLSARDPAPPPADLSSVSTPVEQGTPPPGIVVTVLAGESVDLTIVLDGGSARTYALEPGEGRSFEADLSVGVELSSGATAQVTVNGRDLGFPGKDGKPWHETFTYSTPTPQG